MELLKKISAQLSKYTSVFVIIVAIITFIFQDAFNWVATPLAFGLNVQSLILGIIMLGMGLTLTVNDFKILAKRPLDICIGAVAQYLIMPLIAWSIASIFRLPDGITVGLILVGSCPGGVSSNIMSYLCGGDVPFSIGMTTVSTLLAPIMTPMLVLALAGTRIDVSFWAMFKSIVQVVIIPIAIGFIMNYFWGKKKAFQDIQKIAPGVAVIGLACIVGGVISSNGEGFFAAGIGIFLAVFFHNSIGYALGFFTGKLVKMPVSKCKTISIEVGMQNAGLATNLSHLHFPALPEAAVASAISCVWHSISGALIAGIYGKFIKNDDSQPQEDGQAMRSL